MTLHVVNMPQTCTTGDYPLCGFTRKTINFCWAMSGPHGFHTILYGGEDNSAKCDEHVVCITKREQEEFLGPLSYIYPPWNPNHPTWVKYNEVVAREILKRSSPSDIVCVLGGNCHALLRKLVDPLKVVEYGIGYTGYFSEYRVWEGNVWRAFCLGKHFLDAKTPNSNETVIPSFFDENEYQLSLGRKDYVLYLGRVTHQKGVDWACKAAERAGKRLLVAGYGDKKLVSKGAEYLGPVSHEEKLGLLSRAEYVMCPTRGLEPFGNVAVEAQLCGTPVIATNWGGHTETVTDGYTGYLCDSWEDMATSLGHTPALARYNIRDRAVERWSRKHILPKYKAYFSRISSSEGCYNP